MSVVLSFGSSIASGAFGFLGARLSINWSIIILLVLLVLLAAGVAVYFLQKRTVTRSTERALRAIQEAEELLAQDRFDPKAADEKIDEARENAENLGDAVLDARILHNEGDYYYELAQQRRKEENLKYAIESYEEALEVRTLELDPLGFAMTNVNLGNAYQDLAHIRDVEANLENAVVSYEKALEVYTADKHPFDYAGTMNNLANTYLYLADVKEPETNLQKAITAYEKVLDIKTADKYPLFYAVTQNNLGGAYKRLAEVIKEDKGIEKEIVLSSLIKAVAAYEKALTIYTTESYGHEHEEIEKIIQDLRRRLNN